MQPIKYKAGYKYQLQEEFTHYTGVRPPYKSGGNGFVMIDQYGLLTIRAGYAWDGASGAMDTKSIMRASLVHDALYQLIRLGVVAEEDRSIADWLLSDMLLEDGLMLAEKAPLLLRGPARALARARAAWVHAAVRAFGGRFSAAGTREEILTAP